MSWFKLPKAFDKTNCTSIGVLFCWMPTPSTRWSPETVTDEKVVLWAQRAFCDWRRKAPLGSTAKQKAHRKIKHRVWSVSTTFWFFKSCCINNGNLDEFSLAPSCPSMIQTLRKMPKEILLVCKSFWKFVAYGAISVLTLPPTSGKGQSLKRSKTCGPMGFWADWWL